MAYKCKQCSQSFTSSAALGGHVRTVHQTAAPAPATPRATQAPADGAYYYGYCPQCRKHLRNRDEENRPVEVVKCRLCGCMFWLYDGRRFEGAAVPRKLTEAERHEYYRRHMAGDFAMMPGPAGRWIPQHPEKVEEWNEIRKRNEEALYHEAKAS